jgi:hypothetical protein
MPVVAFATLILTGKYARRSSETFALKVLPADNRIMEAVAKPAAEG